MSIGSSMLKWHSLIQVSPLGVMTMEEDRIVGISHAVSKEDQGSRGGGYSRRSDFKLGTDENGCDESSTGGFT